MSFRETATLSMLATAERQHADRVIRIRKYKMRVLPIAVVYGGNASGKTNLMAALSFAKEFVLNGTRPEHRIQVQPFLLDSLSIRQPTRFSFELLINDILFEYSFTVTDDHVLSEKLVKISSSSERTLFDRQAGQIRLVSHLERDQFLRFAFSGTRDNELFLTNSVSQNVDHFRPVSDWFRDSLTFVGTRSYRAVSFSQDDRFRSRINKLLRHFDTGINALDSIEVPVEAIPFPEERKDDMLRNLKEGYMLAISAAGGHHYSISRKDGRIRATKIVSMHKSSDGELRPFDMALESESSRRLIDIPPYFVELSARGQGGVCMIDELDRSLHTSLSRSLIENYLAVRDENSRSQLIFSTHDIQLMDQGLLRRDEIWVTERLSDGTTRLYSMSDFKGLRNDKDLRKSYLEGRLGGVPFIGYSSTAFENQIPVSAS